MSLCPICNQSVVGKKNQVYCSTKCGAARRKKGKDIPCKICGKLFYAKLSQKQVFCSLKCKYLGAEKRKIKSGKYLECPQCNKEVYICNSTLKLNKHGMRFCSRKCRGNAMKERKVTWGFARDGKIKGRNVYPRKQINNVRMKEHRRVMQDHIGRKLESSEHVHHINGNPLDNRIENLIIVTPEQHGKIHKTRN